jgi:hypothetical protein
MKRAAIALGAVLYLAFGFALFVFMHTGARAVEACGGEGSYRTGGVSYWPPGTECAGPAPPASTIVVFNGGYVVVLLLGSFVALLAGALVMSRARAAASADRGRRRAAGAG